MPPDEIDLEEDWADLRPASPITLARNDLSSMMEVAAVKTEQDIKQWLKQRAGKESHPAPLDKLLGEIVVQAVAKFWEHLTTGAKAIDTVGLIEIILSTQNLPAQELKVFVRALPRTLLDRLIQSQLGAQAGGIHALLALEVMVRDGHENDYKLTTLPSGGVEVAIQPRAKQGQQLTFRLSETFSLDNAPREVESTRAETPNAIGEY